MKSPAAHFFITVIACVLALFACRWWYTDVETKSVDVANLQQQIYSETQTAGIVGAARAEIARISSDEVTLQNYFVPQTGVVSFINFLEGEGRSQGSSVKILSVSPGTGTPPTLVLKFTIGGTFDAVMRTVGTIEYSQYDLYVSQFSVTQDGTNSWNANVGLVVGSINLQTATSTP